MYRAVALGCALAAVASLAALPLPALAHTNDVHADAQVSADGTVVAETVFVAEAGWLVLYRNGTADGAANGTDGGPLGHAAVGSGSGLERDVAVEVPAERWRTFGPNATVRFVVHHDDGDGSFEPRGDDPVLTSFGSPVASSFTLAKGRAAALVTARRFAPQEPNASTVAVRRATLPVDGHLVVTGADGTEPVLGATSLSAGTHRNVTVDLNRSRIAHRTGTSGPRSLRATLHRDDGDGTFDAGDRPVRAGDGTVGTTFRVRLDGPTPDGTHDDHSTGTHNHHSTGTHNHRSTGTHNHRSTGTHSPAGTPSPSVAVASTPSPTRTPEAGTAGAGTRGGGTGFGARAVIVALVTLAAGALARRVRR